LAASCSPIGTGIPGQPAQGGKWTHESAAAGCGAALELGMGSIVASCLLVLGWLPMLFGVRRGRSASTGPRARPPSDGPRLLRRDRSGPRSEPRFVDRIQLLLTWAACIAVTFLALVGVWRSPAPLRIAAGTGLFLTAVGFWLWARRAHGDEYAQLPRVPPALVTAGPYRVVRHPLYLATLGAVTGQAIAAGTWVAGAIALGLAIQLAIRAQREERLLARSLGAEWQSYAVRVQPGLPTGRGARPS
jgi:protein-S-isoprenylcysteine O-methyltransferase